MLKLSLLLSVSLVVFTGCATTASSDPSSGVGTEVGSELTAETVDPVALANAKTFYEALLEQDEHRAESTIAYRELPPALARQVAHDNPNPKDDWAAEAFRTKVKDSAGHLVVMFAVEDGIDDEGASITIYSASGKKLADGDDYRGFEWNN
jgi:hypothetical protein